MAILGGSYRPAPDREARFLVQVRNPDRPGKAQEGRHVEVFLNTPDRNESEAVFAGDSGADGTVQLRFNVPDEPLEVRADTVDGESSIFQDVFLGRAHNALVTTDKPV